MALKLYTDGHIALSIVRQLRSKDVDIERCEDVGLKDATLLKMMGIIKSDTYRGELWSF